MSIQPPFLMFLASLWIVVEVYCFVWPNFDFLWVFSLALGATRAKNVPFDVIFISVLRVALESIQSSLLGESQFSHLFFGP